MAALAGLQPVVPTARARALRPQQRGRRVGVPGAKSTRARHTADDDDALSPGGLSDADDGGEPARPWVQRAHGDEYLQRRVAQYLAAEAARPARAAEMLHAGEMRGEWRSGMAELLRVHLEERVVQAQAARVCECCMGQGTQMVTGSRPVQVFFFNTLVNINLPQLQCSNTAACALMTATDVHATEIDCVASSPQFPNIMYDQSLIEQFEGLHMLGVSADGARCTSLRAAQP
jgi:hypothetical protein